MLKLIIEDDEGRKTVVPFAREEITIGRQEGNTIRLTERNVSRRHARLLKQTGQVLLEDLGSYNGIRVNGDRISGQVQVNDGDLIQIGDYDLALQGEQPQAATVPLDPRATAPLRPQDVRRINLEASPPTYPSLPAVDAPLAQDDDIQEAGADDVADLGTAPEVAKNQATAVIRMDQVEGRANKRSVQGVDPAQAPRLVVLNTDFAGRDFPCLKTELRIGRTDDNDIALDHRSLSRTHCKLVREESGEWRVIDMQSANGLMVNGEPYAQVPLRLGDVLELGHVKFKFVGPNEDVGPTPTTSSAITQETGDAASKAPLIALVVAGLVIVLGGGGYVFYKSQQTELPTQVTTKPPKDPTVKVPVDPPPEDPAAARAALDQKLGEARAAIAALDWSQAETLLQNCKLDGQVHPEARALLTQMDGERGFKAALESAATALQAGDLDRARTELESSRDTKLLKQQHQKLEAMRAEEVKKKVAVAPPKPPPTPPRVNAASAEAQALLEEASALSKSKNYEAAAIRLEKCIKVAPMFHPCYRVLGSAYAKLAARDGSAPDREKARKYYERYLEVAPPDDEYVPKVRNILEQAKDQQ